MSLRFLKALLLLSTLVAAVHCGSARDRDDDDFSGSRSDGGRGDAGRTDGGGGDGGTDCTPRWNLFPGTDSVVEVKDGTLVLLAHGTASSQAAVSQATPAGDFHLKIQVATYSGTRYGDFNVGLISFNSGKQIYTGLNTARAYVESNTDMGSDGVDVSASSATVEFQREGGVITGTISAGGKTATYSEDFGSDSFTLALSASGDSAGPTTVAITDVTMLGDSASPLNDTFDCDTVIRSP